MRKKIYVAGGAADIDREKNRYKFGYASSKLRERGYAVINPFSMLEDTRHLLDTESELTICFAAISVCDSVYMLDDWAESLKARAEHEFALKQGKEVIYESAMRKVLREKNCRV